MRVVVRGGLERLLRRWWRGDLGASGRVLDVLAAPAEWAYRGALAVRNRRLDRVGGAAIPGLGVVSVGNLAVGGTGKTPVAAWAARALAGAGARVALVSRGYGRDELLLHRRWNPAVPVIADPDRLAAAAAARAQGADVVVLDDGFQHRRLARDVDVVLLAAEDSFPARVLPRGPFREPAASLARADAVVITRRTATSDDAEAVADRVRARFPRMAVGRVALGPAGWRDFAGASGPPPEGPTLSVAAVARPELFAAQVEAETGARSELMAFPDHHEFGPADVKAMRARARGRTVVVTEKDAVKLEPQRSALEPVRVFTEALRWESGEVVLTELVTAAKGP